MTAYLKDQWHRGEVEGVEEGLGEIWVGDHNLINVHVQGSQVKGVGGGELGLADRAAFGVEDNVAAFSAQAVPFSRPVSEKRNISIIPRLD